MRIAYEHVQLALEGDLKRVLMERLLEYELLSIKDEEEVGDSTPDDIAVDSVAVDTDKTSEEASVEDIGTAEAATGTRPEGKPAEESLLDRGAW